MCEAKFIQIISYSVFIVAFLVDQCRSNNNVTSSKIDVCFYIKYGDLKRCKTFENFTSIREFMSTPYAKVEIHDQVLTKVYKYSLSRIRYTNEVIIRNCGLSEIEPGAFLGSLSILKFDIQQNYLETIKTGVFNKLLITHLNLSFNKIRTIESDALSYLQNIEEVYLINNLISTYDGKWFNKAPLLRTLYFQNNTINSIPEKAFRNLIDRPFDPNIFFSFNKITNIHRLAFTDMGTTIIGKLYLDHNLLEAWGEGLSMNINELKISFNYIKCIHGDIHSTIKYNSLDNFIQNPYNCSCLKEIKKVGDERGDHSTWFRDKYQRCREDAKPKWLRKRIITNNLEIFSSP